MALATIPQMSFRSPGPTGTEGENVAALQDSTPQQTKAWLSESNRPSAESEDAGGPELVFNKAPDKAEVGQILSAIDTSDGQAVVVRLTVVDVKQGLDSLRLLLQKHQIAGARESAVSAATMDTRSPRPTPWRRIEMGPATSRSPGWNRPRAGNWSAWSSGHPPTRCRRRWPPCDVRLLRRWNWLECSRWPPWKPHPEDATH